MPEFIPSPYNFVPPPEKLFFPDNENPNLPDVSHDMPFADGISGKIELTVTSETPIFIRGKDKDCPDFCATPDGRFMIPGSSIKGCLRAVFSVVTASALECYNRHYSIRDLHNQEDYMHFMTVNGEPTVRAGWLRKEDEKWWIIPCEFQKIPHENLERHNGKQLDLGRKQSAEDKYSHWDGAHDSNREIRTPDGKLGTVVFTGQPSNRKRDNKKDRSKKHEFVFFNRKEDAKTQVPEQVAENFRHVHSESRPARRDRNNPSSNTEASKEGHPNEEWSYWLETFEKGGEVPVFYLAYEDGRIRKKTKSKQLEGNPSELYAFGLAMMFRLPYRHDIHHARNNTSPDSYARRAAPESTIRDLTEAVFGYIDGPESLKGRLSFEPLVNSNQARVLAETSKLLSEPRPSFYPNYIKQNPGTTAKNQLKDHEYRTLHSDKAMLRGFKRYPVRNRADSSRSDSENASRFKPLDSGAKFEGTVYFHNLRPFELGALLWTIYLGDKAEKESPYRHSIGMAKPFGYGQIRLGVHSIETIDGRAIDPLPMTKAFEEKITSALPDWMMSLPMKELLAMANPTKTAPIERFQYPELDDFRKFKGSRDSKNPAPALLLEPYSEQIPVDEKSIGATATGIITDIYPVGEEVTIMALKQSKKQKKDGRWSFFIQDEDRESSKGRISKEDPLPEGLQAGKSIRAYVKEAHKGNFIFTLQQPDST